MNLKHYSLVFCALLLMSTGCKKNTENPIAKESPSQLDFIDDDFQATLVSVNTSYQPRQVITIAGKAFERGYREGTGNQARFDVPWGIELASDGNLLVADPENDRIRKVTPEGVVTSLSIPAATNGAKLSRPYYVRQNGNGTIAIKGIELGARYWAVNPDGKTTVTAGTRNGFYGALAKDPYENYFWTSGINIVGANLFTGFIEKFTPSGTLGTDARDFSASEFTGDVNERQPTITPMYVGYNKVKYMVVTGRHIYKLTPSGELKQLFTNFTFESPIDDIIANRDSRTLYLTSGGNIYSISSNKLTRLVGPNTSFDGRDGVGKSADVRAFNLALSKDENTLYFTDTRNSVRKLILK